MIRLVLSSRGEGKPWPGREWRITIGEEATPFWCWPATGEGGLLTSLRRPLERYCWWAWWRVMAEYTRVWAEDYQSEGDDDGSGKGC